jgi:hypothetical protein
MKKILLAGIALLALFASAHADERWEADFHRCYIHKWFSKDELSTFGQPADGNQEILIELKDISDIEKALRVMKRCAKWIQCLNERAEGKVRHCTEGYKRRLEEGREK